VWTAKITGGFGAENKQGGFVRGGVASANETLDASDEWRGGEFFRVVVARVVEFVDDDVAGGARTGARGGWRGGFVG
jgi:hypothetical protein